MANIESIKLGVESYLSQSDTEYAIMIDGDWGTGKTHLYKNQILPIIGEGEAIYLSLYGLSSIADIENEIYKSLTFLGGDDEGFFKNILNSNPGLMEDIKVGGLGYAVQYGLKKWKSKELEKSKSLTFCFDDFERWEGKIDGNYAPLTQ